MEVFMSLIDELKKEFVDSLRQIVFSGFGEPFMDRSFLHKLSYARAEFPGTHFSIFTNGSFLKGHHCHDLKEIDNVSVMVSLNSTNADMRSKLMNVSLADWGNVEEACLSLEHHKINWGTSLVAHPIVTADRGNEFMTGHNPIVCQFQSWGGLMYPYNGPLVYRCDRLFDWYTFDWQGKRIKCCFDINGKADCNQCTEGVRV